MHQPQAVTEPAPQSLATLRPGQVRYALWLLLAIYTVNFLDRQILNILMEDIKREFMLDDWQLGMLGGTAFAMFYVTLGIPIARLAEHYNRATIINVSVLVWSGFTVLCGAAQSYWQLAAARIGVGIGEAGCTPPAHSLISDYVSPQKRASALAFYHMGTPLGVLLGMVVGGIVADLYGWRTAFFVAGAPGIILAIIGFLSLPEPRQHNGRRSPLIKIERIPIASAFAELAAKPTFWLVAAGGAIKAFIGNGHAPFTASFFLRSHGEEITAIAASIGMLPKGFLGVALGLTAGLAGLAGTLIGGAIADRYARKDIRAYVTLPALTSLVSVPVFFAAASVSDPLLALALMAVPVFVGGLAYGPIYATVQTLVRPQVRATASASFLFIVNLVGLGLGPLGVGLLSDFLGQNQGMGAAEGLRWALILTMTSGLSATLLFWLARRTIARDITS